MDKYLIHALDIIGKHGAIEKHMPSTEVYNESWMIRAVLDYYAKSGLGEKSDILHFYEEAEWFSEALLKPPFLKSCFERAEKLHESLTHSDGVIGHFKIKEDTKSALELSHDAKQFIVLEAKMFSNLSPNVTNARGYNQAARTVACIAQTVPLNSLGNDLYLGFYVIAPKEKFEKENTFKEWLDKEHIAATVEKRIEGFERYSEYYNKLFAWYKSHFSAVLKKIIIKQITWEMVVAEIIESDSAIGLLFKRFYESCIENNRGRKHQGFTVG